MIPMDKSIHTAFKNSSFWIFRHFLPVIGKFLPGLLGIAGNKRSCFLKKRDKTTRELSIINSIHQSRSLCETIPSGTEYTRMTNWTLICNECSSIGKFSI